MKLYLKKLQRRLRTKSILPSPRVELSLKELMMWQSGSPDAVIRYREMRLSDLLQEEEDFRFTVRIVLI